MIVWVLLAHIASTTGTPMPYLAFRNHDDCEQARLQIPSDHGWDAHADCVPFGADTSELK